MLFLAIISAALTKTSNNTYDNGNRRRGDNSTANKNGLRKVRAGNFSFKTLVTKVKLTDTVVSYCVVLDFANRVFVPCLPRGQKDIIQSRVRKVGPNVPTFTQVYNHQISLVSADCTAFEIEHKVFDAVKNYANLPRGSAESQIFALVVEVYPTINGIVLPSVSRREVKYYSVITRGQVEVAELKFNKSLIARHLPQNRDDLHAVLDSVPIEPLHFAADLPRIIASFQGISVQDQPGWADLPPLDLNQPFLLPVSFDDVEPGLLTTTPDVEQPCQQEQYSLCLDSLYDDQVQQQVQLENHPLYCPLSDDEQVVLMEEASSIETNAEQYKRETCTVEEPYDTNMVGDEVLDVNRPNIPTPQPLGGPTDAVFMLDDDISIEYLDDEHWSLI